MARAKKTTRRAAHDYNVPSEFEAASEELRATMRSCLRFEHGSGKMIFEAILRVFYGGGEEPAKAQADEAEAAVARINALVNGLPPQAPTSLEAPASLQAPTSPRTPIPSLAELIFAPTLARASTLVESPPANTGVDV